MPITKTQFKSITKGTLLKGLFEDGEWYEGSVIGIRKKTFKLKIQDENDTWIVGLKETTLIDHKIKVLNKKSLDSIEKEILKAIQDIAKKRGLEFKFQGGSFQDTNAKLKLSILVKGGVTREGTTYNFHAKQYGLPKLNSVIDYKGEKIQFTGWASRAKKYPVLYTKLNSNKTFKCSIDFAKSMVDA